MDRVETLHLLLSFAERVNRIIVVHNTVSMEVNKENKKQCVLGQILLNVYGLKITLPIRMSCDVNTFYQNPPELKPPGGTRERDPC